MTIAQTTFGSLSSMRTDHRLSRALKPRTYQRAVCSTHNTLSRGLDAHWASCLHAITGQDYRVTATYAQYDLLRAIRQRRPRHFGHILRMPESGVVRRALVALTEGGTAHPEGSLFMDCHEIEMERLVALA